MNLFKFANSDLTPIAGAALAFVSIGLAAAIALVALAGPAFSLASLLP
ncbi:MAG: hypothetical protein MEP57_04820 [Microvirga sp.]|nr:hypothetical protein [Microvirga sp.]